MNRIIPFFSLFLFFNFTSLFAQQAVLQGKIYDEYQNPIENAHVFLEEFEVSAFSSANGEYHLSIPVEQSFRVRFQHIAYKDTVLTVKLSAREKRTINVTMSVRGEQLKTVDIRAKYNDGYVRIDPKLNFKVPTPSGGVESLIKMLPGASSTNELSSQYNVRGGNYDENLVYVNDIEIHRPFLVRSAQQEGMGFVNLDLTNSVKFSAGGFEPKYGDKMSSVLDVQYRKPTQYAGSVSGSLLGANAHVEGNVNDVFTFLVGVRYKSNSYILKSMEAKGDYKPRFFDAQMLLTWTPIEKLEISLLGNFSKNQYLYVPTTKTTNFGPLENLKRMEVYYDGQEVDKYENYLGGLTFNYKYNSLNNIKLILSSYYAKESETYDIQGQYWLKDIEADMNSNNDDMAREVSVRSVGTYLEHARNNITAIVSAADLRGEHRLRNNTILWGVKVQNEVIHDKIKEWYLLDSSDYTLPHIPTTPSDSIPVPYDDPSRELTLGENNYLASQNDLNTIRISGFIQDVWKIDGDSANRFTLIGGLRYSFWSYNKEFTVSPRLNFLYKPRWKSDWLFVLKTGLYYQPPFYREMRNKDGELNSDIKSQRSFQVVAGAEYNFKMWRRPFKFTAEAYYKYMDRLVSYTVDNVKIIYSGQNDAKGYATGIDMKLSGEFIPGLESWVSLSLMRTAEDIENDAYYSDKDGQMIEPGYIPRPSDQTFSINIFFQDNMPGFDPLRVHLNFVFSSGLPYSAPNTPRYNVLYYTSDGKKHVNRTPWYRRVDVGFSYMLLEANRDRLKHKSKAIRAVKSFGIFFEVFNLLGTNNVASYSWIKTIVDDSTGQTGLIPVPNYLTSRLFNLKLALEF